MHIHSTMLIILAALAPRVAGPLFHNVSGHWRVDSIEFTRRMMSARGGAA